MHEPELSHPFFPLKQDLSLEGLTHEEVKIEGVQKAHLEVIKSVNLFKCITKKISNKTVLKIIHKKNQESTNNKPKMSTYIYTDIKKHI